MEGALHEPAKEVAEAAAHARRAAAAIAFLFQQFFHLLPIRLESSKDLPVDNQRRRYPAVVLLH